MTLGTFVRNVTVVMAGLMGACGGGDTYIIENGGEGKDISGSTMEQFCSAFADCDNLKGTYETRFEECLRSVGKIEKRNGRPLPRDYVDCVKKSGKICTVEDDLEEYCDIDRYYGNK